MAQIRKVTRGGNLSDFRQSVTPAGGGFGLMADIAEAAYAQLYPAAEREMQEKGGSVGRDLARQQIGDPKGAVTVSSMGGGNVSESLATTESGGNYNAKNSEGFTGKYQWGQARLDDYNRANGTGHTLSEFIAGDAPEDQQRAAALQERTQQWHEADILKNLGDLQGRTVNGVTMTPGALIGAAHLGGIGGARKFVESNGAYDPADSNGTKLSDYARTHGGAQVTASSSGGGTFEPTMLREADGTLSSRLYSPLGGPLSQAHNAAAGVAYTSEVMVKGLTDIMGMSEQFTLDPDGFQQAAREYVDGIAANAPEAFRGDVRNNLQTEVKRRVLGMVEERHRDIRQRADNGSRALVERWSDGLSSAIASGNQEEIAAARSQLDGVLRARESLPGIAWTPEQSQNVLIKAEDEASRRVQKAQDDQRSGWKKMLGLVTKAAEKFRTAEDETILQNPAVREAFPDEWREAAAFVTLRDEMPSFMAMPPKEQAAALAEMKSEPVSAPWEMEIYGAAEKAAQVNAKAWEEDPIARAAEVLPTKPPEIPAFDPANPEGFIEALGARAAYGAKLKGDGFINFDAMLTDEEAKNMGAMFSKDVPPEMKAAMAGAVVSGLGDGAAAFFSEIKNDDPVTRYSGMLMARGGSAEVATQAMRGQAMLDEGLVQPPPKAASIGAVSVDIAAALSLTPAGPKGEGELLKFATAIYASEARGIDPTSDAAKTLMESAMQRALGRGKNRRGLDTGGVQKIGGSGGYFGAEGQPVLLPPNMAGDDLNGAMEAAFAPELSFSQQIAPIFGDMGNTGALWAKAGNGAPMLEGKPLPQHYFNEGMVSLTPEGGNMYRMSVNMNGIISDVRGADGKAFIFDADKLITAHRSGQ